MIVSILWGSELKNQIFCETGTGILVVQKFFGQEISLENIDYKRPGDAGISCAEGFDILKHKAKVNIKKSIYSFEDTWLNMLRESRRNVKKIRFMG